MALCPLLDVVQKTSHIIQYRVSIFLTVFPQVDGAWRASTTQVVQQKKERFV